MTDLELALTTIQNKNAPYTTLYSYLDGAQPLKFSTERLRRAFAKSSVYFAENAIAIIINSVLDRLVLKGFTVADDSANTALNQLFKSLNLQLDSYDVHESALLTGEAFIVVDMTDGQPEIYFNDPRLVAVFYDADRPKVKSFAAKKWTDSAGVVNLKLYYSDRMELYSSPKGTTATSYKLVESIPNEFGIIPVFHFRTSRRIVKGELDNSIISLQDAINKLFSDMMVSAEFEAFKTRVFMTNADPGDMKIGPDMKIWIPTSETPNAQPQSVTEIGGSTLTNFLEPMTQLMNTLAILTRTPRHLLFNIGSNVSGESLLVEESPLVKKVEQRRETYEVTWIELASFLLQILGIKVNPSEIQVDWGTAETKQPLTEAQTIQTEVSAGIPLQAALKRNGAAQDEIDEIMAEKQVVDSQKQQNLANSLLAFNRQ